MNKHTAEIIRRLASGSREPVRDGTLRQAYNPFDSNNESLPGPSRPDRVHPEAGSGPQQSLGQHAVVTDTTGRAPRTRPGPMEGREQSGSRLTHTGDEKGEAIVDMLLAMGVPEPVIETIMMEMSYGR